MWKKDHEPAGCFVGHTPHSNKTFFGFGLADSMFSGDVDLRRRPLNPAEVRAIVDAGVVPCLNPSHAATIAVMRGRFGIDVPIPEKAPVVRLDPGDALLVMGVAGLPRLEGRHEYTDAEVAAARWSFALYTVSATPYGPGHSGYDAEGDEE